jgi:hypothetical protein
MRSGEGDAVEGQRAIERISSICPENQRDGNGLTARMTLRVAFGRERCQHVRRFPPPEARVFSRADARLNGSRSTMVRSGLSHVEHRHHGPVVRRIDAG